MPESPSVDKYNVSGTNGTCLLASMGLQLNLTYERKDNTVRLGPHLGEGDGTVGLGPLLPVH